VEAILGLPYIFSLFKSVHALIKVAQGINVFVCDFKESMKVAHQEFCMFYCDPYVKFEGLAFDDFNVIEALTNSNFPMEWFSDLNAWHSELRGIFLCWPHVSCILHSDDGVGGLQLVTKLAFNWAFNKVKEECEGVTQGLVSKL